MHLERELVETHSPELNYICPCCQQEKLPLGLFADNPEMLLPDSLQMDNEPRQFKQISPNTIYSCGRFFNKIDTFLPINKINSPIVCRLWAEIGQDDFEQIVSVDDELLTEIDFQGHLATDIPGFAGTIGADITIHYSQKTILPVMTACKDSRIKDLDDTNSHQAMVSLYRKIWGNANEVVQANNQQREALNSQLKTVIDKPVYRKYITPPPELAGVRPAEIIVAPPLDTGDEVSMATIGCSDNPDIPVEFITWVKNPSHDFIKNFADFGYLSRLNNSNFKIEQGLLIPEQIGIPDTEMCTWLVWNLWNLETETIDLNTIDGNFIRLFSLIPIHDVEVLFIQAFGPQRFIDLLFESLADPTDLERESVVPEPG